MLIFYLIINSINAKLGIPEWLSEYFSGNMAVQIIPDFKSGVSVSNPGYLCKGLKVKIGNEVQLVVVAAVKRQLVNDVSLSRNHYRNCR
jgi:hypothetical protein